MDYVFTSFKRESVTSWKLYYQLNSEMYKRQSSVWYFERRCLRQNRPFCLVPFAISVHFHFPPKQRLTFLYFCALLLSDYTIIDFLNILERLVCNSMWYPLKIFKITPFKIFHHILSYIINYYFAFFFYHK